jgi:hypothetical protein
MELVDQRSDADWLQTNTRPASAGFAGWWGWRWRVTAIGATRCDERVTHAVGGVSAFEAALRISAVARFAVAGREKHVNHKRVHRVYREAGSDACGGRSESIAYARESRSWRGLRRTRNGRWILCTMRWSAGGAIRMLSVVDAYTRECPALEVDTSFASRRVTRVLDGDHGGARDSR